MVPKTCSTCDFAKRSFWKGWRCSHPTVVSQFDPVKGRSVPCEQGRKEYSRCGKMGYCYAGPAEIQPKDMSSSTVAATLVSSASYTISAALEPSLKFSTELRHNWPKPIMSYSPSSRIYDTRCANLSGGGGGGFLPGMALGYMMGARPATPTAEPWSGNGGDMNGGGATDSWDSCSDDSDHGSCDSSDSGGSDGGGSSD
jgi:hypothetical protein